jgi:KUP system potassium uptake protein
MVGCIALVLGFQTASNLAAAYGIAVTGTMAITSLLFSMVARQRFGWSAARAGLFLGFFLLVDLSFFSANLHKLSSGGWLPLAVGTGLFIVATTWWRGRLELSQVIGSAVFMTSQPSNIPQVLLHHVKHNKVLHQQVVLLSIDTANVPYVRDRESLEVQDLGNGFWRVHARVGFMQEPRVPRILLRCKPFGLVLAQGDTTYYMGRQTLLTGGKSKMARWRKTLFSFLARNSRPPTAFFDLPPNRVVELGMQIEL